MFSRSEASQSVPQRVLAIEAWLDEQPDPFIDHERQPLERPPPSKRKSKRRSKGSSAEKVQDADKISKVTEVDDRKSEWTNSGGRRRKGRRSRSSRDGDTDTPDSAQSAGAARQTDVAPNTSPRAAVEVQGLKDNSPGRLRRRGARALRSRGDSHPVAQIIHEDEATPGGSASSSNSPLIRPHKVFSERQQYEIPVRPGNNFPPRDSHPLSTIASVESFQAHDDKENNTGSAGMDSKGLQRRLTTHEDLMSVLSLPRTGGSIKSARTVHTAKTRISAASLAEIFEELGVGEARYMRELKTLVDGVIPVLLQCVLSKSDSAAAAGLFSSSGSARDDLNFTKPIVDMGVALERLKTLHRRIPTHDLNSLLTWAHGAHKVYLEYLKAWRLGFQDVVVNLAPPDEQSRAEIDQGMARDQDGDVINSKGEKVDVAYLLKRPLVRIKNLAKIFSRLKIIKPSPKASTVADQYEDLIKTARQRSSEEQSRLEDEAAANIDATKARDLRSLAAFPDVTINRSRRVRARDGFGLTIHHSTGQRLDCQIELLIRDNTEEDGGDLLICEVENNGRWLLFPPFETGSISSRRGNRDGEIVVMVRHLVDNSVDWHELLLLRTDDIDAVSEWVSMLGSDPLPPKLNRTSSFTNDQYFEPAVLLQDSPSGSRCLSSIPKTPSPKKAEIPLGEPSTIGRAGGERGSRSTPSIQRQEKSSMPPLEIATQGDAQVPKQMTKEAQARLPSTPSSQHQRTASTQPLSSTSTPALKRSRLAARRPVRRGESVSMSAESSNFPTPLIRTALSTPTQRTSCRETTSSRDCMSSPDTYRTASSGPRVPEHVETPVKGPKSEVQRPEYHRTKSSTPSNEVPIIPRLRPSNGAKKSRFESLRERWTTVSNEEKKSTDETPYSKTMSTPSKPAHRLAPLNPTATDKNAAQSKRRSQGPSLSPPIRTENRPIPPPHRVPLHQEIPKVEPVLKAQPQSSPRSALREERRSSSPLKHQYAPSTSSESDESSDPEESIASSTSETSEDGATEQREQTQTLPAGKATNSTEAPKIAAQASLSNLPAETLAPSNSASQAPYRTVPHLVHPSTTPLARKIATVCAWSEKGVWESLHPDECSIVVSPGLIQAYEMSAAHSQVRDGEGFVAYGSSCEENDEGRVRPLVGFELTPLVPLRRGTALDISIRSPPTSESKIKTSTNIMFRSRNAQECEELYAEINYARINNPTWIALERARPKEAPTVTFDTSRGSARHSRAASRTASWFGFGSSGRKPSYRASSAPRSRALSIGGMSESSAGSMSSALSALRRLSGAESDGKSRFNLNRSSVGRRNGRLSTGGITSLYSSSSTTTRTGGSGSGATSPAPSQLALAPTTDEADAIPASAAPAGTLNNVKVRLYVRETASRWRDMGSGLLCVMSAPVLTGDAGFEDLRTATDLDPSPPGTAPGGGSLRPASTFTAGQPTQTYGPRLSSSKHTPHRTHGDGSDKRILITGKTKGETLLDATLHESCFERIARTGIAISVWEEHAEVAKSGGVVGGKSTTYMMQMRGQAEASWVFGLVGRLRY